MTSIATYSYGLAALAFLFLSVMLMTRWRSRTHATAITIASVASLLWSTSLAWQAASGAVCPISTDKFQFYRYKNPIDPVISKRVFYRRTKSN